MTLPVLILGHRRPDFLRRQIVWTLNQNLKVYVHLDGIPSIADKEFVDAVADCRSIVKEYEEHIVASRILESNYGCFKGVKSGIDWAFGSEDHLLILEDDISIAEDFLQFVSYHLNVFRFDYSIAGIASMNFVPPQLNGLDDARLSIYPSSWGWATWRDRWLAFREFPLLRNLIHTSPRDRYWNSTRFLFWCHVLLALKTNRIDSWAYRWAATNIELNRKTIFPNSNMSINLGFGDKSTHTKGDLPAYLPSTFESTASTKSKSYSHSYISYNEVADNWIEKYHLGMSLREILPELIRSTLKYLKVS